MADLTDGGEVAVHVDQVEVGDGGEAHRLPGPLLRLLQRAAPRKGVDGQHLARLEPIVLVADCQVLTSVLCVRSEAIVQADHLHQLFAPLEPMNLAVEVGLVANLVNKGMLVLTLA